MLAPVGARTSQLMIREREDGPRVSRLQPDVSVMARAKDGCCHGISGRQTWEREKRATALDCPPRVGYKHGHRPCKHTNGVAGSLEQK